MKRKIINYWNVNIVENNLTPKNIKIMFKILAQIDHKNVHIVSCHFLVKHF